MKSRERIIARARQCTEVRGVISKVPDATAGAPISTSCDPAQKLGATRHEYPPAVPLVRLSNQTGLSISIRIRRLASTLECHLIL